MKKVSSEEMCSSAQLQRSVVLSM